MIKRKGNFGSSMGEFIFACGNADARENVIRVGKGRHVIWNC